MDIEGPGSGGRCLGRGSRGSSGLLRLSIRQGRRNREWPANTFPTRRLRTSPLGDVRPPSKWFADGLERQRRATGGFEAGGGLRGRWLGDGRDARDRRTSFDSLQCESRGLERLRGSSGGGGLLAGQVIVFVGSALAFGGEVESRVDVFGVNVAQRLSFTGDDGTYTR